MSTDDDSDLLTFSDDEPVAHHAGGSVWKVLIVDDDRDVHQATEFALAATPILGRPLVFVHAYSAAEAVEVLRAEDGIAVILLDVVMESDDAGLALVKTIRNDMQMAEVRIILRTGQPGYAPGIDAIRDYDINDYKTKSELSRNRLFTTLTAAIRSYDQIHAINASRRGLHLIMGAGAKLLSSQALDQFGAGVIEQAARLLDVPAHGMVCAWERGDDAAQAQVIAASGRHADCLNRPLASLNNDEAARAMRRAVTERRSQFEASGATLYLPSGSGYELVARIDTGRALADVDAQLLGVFCSNIVISLDNVMLFGQLKDHAYNDQLLGIPNRLAYVRAVDDDVAAGAGDRTIALVDIDHFSELNDALGHTYGDQLLTAVTERLRTAFGSEVMIARAAADTFGLLGPDAAVTPDAIRALFAAPFVLDGAEHLLSASTGFARLSEVDGDGSDAVKCANVALNRAKDGRRGEHVYYLRDMELDTRNRVRLLQDLRNAFERNRLFVVYQPQLNLTSRRVVGVEALLRWRNDAGQLVPPAHFIPLAENSGLIISLGEWVLRSACIVQRQFLREGIGNVRMAVNVSVSQFRHPDFIGTVDAIIEECDIDPAALELEITESVAMLDSDAMVAMIDAVRRRGIAIAIDDFGTGFSSLSYLERLNVNRLKIDRSFVAQMSQGASSQRIVETIVQLGRSLDLDVIAEGIENEPEAGALAAMGCHEGQGYLFAKPLEVQDVIAYIRQANG